MSIVTRSSSRTTGKSGQIKCQSGTFFRINMIRPTIRMLEILEIHREFPDISAQEMTLCILFNSGKLLGFFCIEVNSCVRLTSNLRSRIEMSSIH